MKYGQWQEEDMSRALAAVRNGDMGVNEAARTYKLIRKSEVVTEFHIPLLFGKAYGLAATIGTAVNAFAKTGVWPVNRDVFHDCHFVAAIQFEIDYVPVMQASTIEPVNEEIPEPNTVIPEKGAIASGSQDSLESLPANAATLAPKLQVSLGEISPIPNNISLGRSTNKAEKIIVITSSPYKQRLKELKSKQLKEEGLKILHRRSQLKPNSRILQMVQ
ncbi:hypothetical protein ANN_21174 [Periplaneta americana]|uniref:HTH psq-type domain-containing protein n=1 Tax=Periplaneta americana TaxID=6978 RepID=A0ABQ8SEL6_PERAM|nr:hypothetical protein ANN_21174 [Periplaneta americana]